MTSLNLNCHQSSSSPQNPRSGEATLPVTSKLKSVRLKSPKNVVISYININSVRNKLGDLASLLDGLVDVLSIAETKLDVSFPSSQFLIPQFKRPYRLDISEDSGGLLTYVREDIPSRLLTEFKFPKDIQILAIELNLKKAKWVLFNIYRPPKQNTSYFLECLSDAITYYSKYQKILITGDFNIEPDNPDMSRFLAAHQFHNHMSEKTCWKSQNGSCIDLIISNNKNSLMNTGTIETGISDHHSLIYTMLKLKYQKLPPKVIKYRDWKYFDCDSFKLELSECLKFNKTYNMESYQNFEKVFEYVLEKYAPLKTKFLRGNNQPHVTRDLRKAIMVRSKLKNKANKTGKPEDLARFRKHRNFVVKLNKKAKKSYFANINSSQKSFWKAIKPFFDKKCSVGRERILLVENDDIVTCEKDLSIIFNTFFNTITDSLEIPQIPGLRSVANNDPVSTAIAKFSQHPSVLNILKGQSVTETFELTKISKDTMIKEVIGLNPKKGVSGVVPIKALKAAVLECADTLTNIYNTYIVENSSFPDELKLAEIIPIHKKNSNTDKSNYRPISLLPVVSKVFERLIIKQMEPFVDNFLSKFLCGFRKGYSTQYSLLNMIRKWESSLNASGIVGAVLMDLSKAFDCLPHDLLIAKLHAYGFGKRALKLINSYLSRRRHYTRVGSSISSILNILLGVPQGSVLGPILFNIFINDLLLSAKEDICNFADDNTMYVCSHDLPDVLSRIHSEVELILYWFKNNGMVANPDKFQTIFLGKGAENIEIKIDSFKIVSSKEVQLLGVTLDNQLTFYPHISNICSNILSKTKALRRIRGYVNQKQADMLFFSHIFSLFDYCPLVWMFCSKQAYNLLNATHKRALKVRFDDFHSSFEELLHRCESVDIHTRNLQLMICEVYKTLNHLNPQIMWDSFMFKAPHKYQLRRGQNLVTPSARTTRAVNSFDFRATMAWNYLPLNIKGANNIEEFSRLLKNVKIHCECRNCSSV